MRTQLLSFLFLSSLTVMGLACGDEGGESDDETGGSAAQSSCYDQCQAQEDGACGVGLDTCHELCDLILDALDADCTAKAQASFDCNIANDEVCGLTMECTSEAEAYAACLQAG